MELAPISSTLQAHASGALWISETATAVVADLHLGYSWAQRRRGELGPLADSRTRQKVFAMCQELNPKRIVFLGDVVHAPRPCAPERAWIEAIFQELAINVELIAVRGNHDRRFAAEFGHLPLTNISVWSDSFITAAHGDRFDFGWPEDHTLILGHLHPCLSIRDSAGAGQKLPVFLAGKHCVLLPAFSPFARGYDIFAGLPEELRSCFRGGDMEVYAATGKRVVRLGPLRTAMDTICESDVSSAAQFRRKYQKR